MTNFPGFFHTVWLLSGWSKWKLDGKWTFWPYNTVWVLRLATHEKGEKQTDLDVSVMGKWAVISLNNDQDQEKKIKDYTVFKIHQKSLIWIFILFVSYLKLGAKIGKDWTWKVDYFQWFFHWVIFFTCGTIYEAEKVYNFISIFTTLFGWVTFMGLIEIIHVVRTVITKKRVIKSSKSRKCHFPDSLFYGNSEVKYPWVVKASLYLNFRAKSKLQFHLNLGTKIEIQNISFHIMNLNFFAKIQK